jgi:hypothetical protein
VGFTVDKYYSEYERYGILILQNDITHASLQSTILSYCISYKLRKFRKINKHSYVNIHSVIFMFIFLRMGSYSHRSKGSKGLGASCLKKVAQLFSKTQRFSVLIYLIHGGQSPKEEECICLNSSKRDNKSE